MKIKSINPHAMATQLTGWLTKEKNLGKEHAEEVHRVLHATISTAIQSVAQEERAVRNWMVVHPVVYFAAGAVSALVVHLAIHLLLK